MNYKKSIITFSLVFGIGLTIGARSTAVQAIINFPDVRSGAFYYQAVSEMAELGFITGYDTGNFGPDDPVTRGQVAVVMNRMWNELVKQGAVSPKQGAPVVRSSSSREASSSSVSVASLSSEASLATSGDLFRFTVDTLSFPESTPKVSVSVARVGGTSDTASVEYETIAGTATSGDDFTSNSGKLQFNQGEKNKTISIHLKNDENFEQAETFIIRIKNPSTGMQIGAPNEIEVTILDNDTDDGGAGGPATEAGRIGFSADAYAVDEEAGTIDVRVVRSEGSKGEASVEYVAKGTTAGSADFDATSGTLTFANGETTKIFSVAVKGNSEIDGNVSVDLFLKNPTGGAVLGVSAAPLAIVDDEISSASGTGTFKMDKQSVTVSERDGISTIQIARISGNKHDVTIDIDTVARSASPNNDFEPLDTTITFRQGESKKSFDVKIIKDDSSESDETFDVILSNPTNGASIGSPGSTTVTIEG